MNKKIKYANNYRITLFDMYCAKPIITERLSCLYYFGLIFSAKAHIESDFVFFELAMHCCTAMITLLLIACNRSGSMKGLSIALTGQSALQRPFKKVKGQASDTAYIPKTQSGIQKFRSL